jgi:hypothetical protein
LHKRTHREGRAESIARPSCFLGAMNTISRATLTATLAALLLPAAASASTIEVTASAGPAAEEYLEYRASKGEDNRVQVHFARNSVVIVDRGTKGITAKGNVFGRCRITSRQRAVCPDFALTTFLRDGDDRLTVAPGDEGSAPTSTDPLAYAEDYSDTEGAVIETLWVDAGSGDDVVTGSRFNDVFIPGTGTDRIEGRAGPDAILDVPDGVVDSFTGGGGVDSVSFRDPRPMTIDLATDLGGPEGELDKIKRIERAHGGGGNDIIRGSDSSDALYGEGGDDQVFGRGGNDLVVGDSPIASEAGVNTLWGDEGDDILDTRARNPRSSVVDCGPGSDRHMGGSDTRLAKTCEFALLRVAFGGNTAPDNEDVVDDDPMKIPPVAKTADSVTFEVPCPRRRTSTGCNGTVTLESPPQSGATPTNYGTGQFTASTGTRVNVTVPLNAAGQTAVAGSDPVAVRVHIDFTPGDPGATHADAGWQDDL